MKKWLVFLFIVVPLECFAQELPIYNEYHLNKSLINPAIIGSEECTWLKATDRHQWLGIEGAPSIQTASVESSIYNKNALRDVDKKVHGLGAFLYRDKNGAYRHLGGQISYAYHVFLHKSKGIKLGMGLSFRFSQNSLDESGFTKEPDPIVTGGVTSSFAPDAGTGLFLYSPKFYAGISAAQLLQGNRNYFLILGYLSGNENDKFRFLPSMVFKTTEDLRKQLDINGKLLIENAWWVSLSYRHNLDILPGMPTSFIPMVGFNKGKFSFGYALDITTGSIQKFNYGTHEFMISYHFCKDGFRCPVYR